MRDVGKTVGGRYDRDSVTVYSEGAGQQPGVGGFKLGRKGNVMGSLRLVK